MNSKQPETNLASTASEADERALDALLNETFGITPSPPDLTTEILSALASSKWDTPTPFVTTSKTATPIPSKRRNRPELSQRKSRKRKWLTVCSAVLTLAASALLAFTLLDLNDITPNQDDAASPNTLAQAIKPSGQTQPNPLKDSDRSASANLEAISSNDDADRSTNNRGDVLPRGVKLDGVPLVRTTAEPSLSNSKAESSPERAQSENKSKDKIAQNHGEMLARFNSSMVDYWARVGVQPAAPIDDTTLAARVKERFGSSLSVNKANDSTADTLSTKQECDAFAAKLVAGLLRGMNVSQEVRESLESDVSKAILEGQPFDELLSRWIAEPDAWKDSSPDRFAESLATNLLDVDASCARCHDSPVDGSYAQHDYWSFASIFLPKDRPALFYELSDGRQRVAEPHIPARWLKSSEKEIEVATQGATSLRQGFSKALVGNRALAAGIVNRIWEVGFGQPLVARASILIAPPRDEAIQKAHQELTDALIASDFDVRTVARLIIASDAMRRGTPDVFQGDQWLVANEQALTSGALAQRTFAASPPPGGKLNRDQLLAAIESRIGGTPKAIGPTGTLLAQPTAEGSGTGQGTRPRKTNPEELAWAKWIADRSLMHDSWLQWIKEPAEQQRHAYYANGLATAESAADLAERLTAPNDDKDIAMRNATNRLAWLLGQDK
jgi:hypothetical protein